MGLGVRIQAKFRAFFVTGFETTVSDCPSNPNPYLVGAHVPFGAALAAHHLQLRGRRLGARATRRLPFGHELAALSALLLLQAETQS
jgi:hypothetical protein